MALFSDMMDEHGAREDALNATITALRDRVAELERERDEALGIKAQWRNLCQQHEQTIIDWKARAARIEAETIERCAKVAVAHHTRVSSHDQRNDYHIGQDYALDCVVKALRALTQEPHE